MRTFKLNRNPYGEKKNLFKTHSICMVPGVTVLVGCNGSGKTTLISQIYQSLKQSNTPVIRYDNLADGGHNARSYADFVGDTNFLISSMLSSEGENIVLNLMNFVRSVGGFVSRNRNSDELFILIDAADSGLSIDNIIDLESVFEVIIKDVKDAQVYIVISANEYELASNNVCLDVTTGKYKKFKSYKAFRNFILRSRAAKDKRYGKEYNV